MKVINFKARLMRGFSVIELMFTLAVGAVILGIGVPSFQTFMETNLLAGSINQLFHPWRLRAARQLKETRGFYCAPLTMAVTAPKPAMKMAGLFLLTATPMARAITLKK